MGIKILYVFLLISIIFAQPQNIHENEGQKQNYIKIAISYIKQGARFVFNILESSLDLFMQIGSHSLKQIEQKYNISYPYSVLLLILGTIVLLILASFFMTPRSKKYSVFLSNFSLLL